MVVAFDIFSKRDVTRVDDFAGFKEAFPASSLVGIADTNRRQCLRPWLLVLGVVHETQTSKNSQMIPAHGPIVKDLLSDTLAPKLEIVGVNYTLQSVADVHDRQTSIQ
jgi:hypothetical protein